jgi:hypothetical protein
MRAISGQAADFRLSEFFSFSSEAEFGEFRPSAPAQVICRLQVSEWRWGEIV